MSLQYDQPTVAEPRFYLPYILSFGILYSAFQMMSYKFNKSDLTKNKVEINEFFIEQREEFAEKGHKLKMKYMAAYLLAKAAMWAKAPYMFILFSNYHQFTVSEIGILYLIDASVSLLSGPFVGMLADNSGRKFVSLFYPLNTIVNLSLRMTGSRSLAYMSQVVTGMGGGILSTAFESWLNYEMHKLYKDNEQYIKNYKKMIFSDIMFYDALLSMLVTTIGTILYTQINIFAPITFAILLAMGCLITIYVTWEENMPNSDGKKNMIQTMNEGFKQLKKPEILCLGLTDSIYACAIQIFIFIWTPILQLTAQSKNINPGMIYICFIFSNLSQNKLLDVINHMFKISYFYLMASYVAFFTFNFSIIFFVEDFTMRLICLTLINGSSGFFNPILSYIKSIIIVEEYRALIMNIFRIPLNVFVIILLLLSSYFDPVYISLFAAILLVVAFIASFYLIIYYWKNLK